MLQDKTGGDDKLLPRQKTLACFPAFSSDLIKVLIHLSSTLWGPYTCAEAMRSSIPKSSFYRYHERSPVAPKRGSELRMALSDVYLLRSEWPTMCHISGAN